MYSKHLSVLSFFGQTTPILSLTWYLNNKKNPD